jgi:exonuclease VII large subunit
MLLLLLWALASSLGRVSNADLEARLSPNDRKRLEELNQRIEKKRAQLEELRKNLPNDESSQYARANNKELQLVQSLRRLMDERKLYYDPENPGYMAALKNEMERKRAKGEL